MQGWQPETSHPEKHTSPRRGSRGGEKVAMMNMKNWMPGKTLLAAALVAGTLTLGAVAAQAAPEFRGGRDGRGGEQFRGVGAGGGREFRGVEHGFPERGFRGPVREGYVGGAYGGGYGVGYVPPSPGAGYFWQGGYDNEGVWFPGAWVFGGGARLGGYGGRGFVGGYDRRGFDRGRVEVGRGGERGFARGGERGFRR